MKERIKNQRIRGIINTEVDMEALNELMHHVNVWNAWDKIDTEKLERYEPSATQSCVNKSNIVKVLQRPKSKRIQTSHSVQRHSSKL